MNPKTKTNQLMQAITLNRVEEIKTLIQAKVDVNSRSDISLTPFQWATMHGTEFVIKLLVDAKGDVNFNGKYTKEQAKATGTTGFASALHQVIIRGLTNTVNVLIEAKANINATNESNITPLSLACDEQNLNIVKILLLHKPNLEIKTTSKQNTALHQACEHTLPTSFQIVRALVEAKASLVSENKENYTPLMITVIKNNPLNTKYLIKAKAIVSFQNQLGFNVLNYAARSSTVNIVQILIEAKADVNANVAGKGYNSYDIARKFNNQAVIELLETLCNEEAKQAILCSVPHQVLKEDMRKKLEVKNKLDSFDRKIPIIHQYLTPEARKKTMQEFFEKVPWFKEAIEPSSLQSCGSLLASMKQQIAGREQEALDEFDRAVKDVLHIETKQTLEILTPGSEGQSAIRLAEQQKLLSSKAAELIAAYEKIKYEFTQKISTLAPLKIKQYLAEQQGQLNNHHEIINTNYANLRTQLDSKLSKESFDDAQRLFTELEGTIGEYEEKVNQIEMHVARLAKEHGKIKQANKAALQKEKDKDKKQEQLKIKTHEKKFKPKKIASRHTKLVEIKKHTKQQFFVASSQRDLNPQPTMASKTVLKKKMIITDNINAAKNLLTKLDTTHLETLNFQELSELKYLLIRLLSEITLNQSQILHNPHLRNMRNTLHRMFVLHGEMNPQVLESQCLQLHQHIQDLAKALTELIGLYQEDPLTQLYYLPSQSFHFTSPVLINMAKSCFDQRNVSDEKFQSLLRDSAKQAKFYWLQVIDLLSQPKDRYFRTLELSDEDRRLTITYAFLSYIMESRKAEPTTDDAKTKKAHHNPYALACQWRHRGRSLKEISDQLPTSFQLEHIERSNQSFRTLRYGNQSIE